ncbi:Lachesin [Gryllus bimaculatus]|nr:Lachesin [Gryllus bimaculatus]
MGAYLCIASNGVPPSVSKRFIVQVHFHPLIKVSNQLVAAPVTSDVLLECYVEASPKAMNSWYRDTDSLLTAGAALVAGEKLMEGSKYEMEETPLSDYALLMKLTIRSLEKRDFGRYMCASVNALGKVEGDVRLQELHLAPKTTAPAPARHDKARKKPSAHDKPRKKKKKKGERGREEEGDGSSAEEDGDEGDSSAAAGAAAAGPTHGGAGGARGAALSPAQRQ